MPAVALNRISVKDVKALRIECKCGSALEIAVEKLARIKSNETFNFKTCPFCGEPFVAKEAASNWNPIKDLAALLENVCASPDKPWLGCELQIVVEQPIEDSGESKKAGKERKGAR
jgi:hypothetical protein